MQVLSVKSSCPPLGTRRWQKSTVRFVDDRGYLSYSSWNYGLPTISLTNELHNGAAEPYLTSYLWAAISA